MELEPSSIEFKPTRDLRRHIPEPPPVRVVAVEDVRLSMPAGLERELDAFYVDLLHFERMEYSRPANVVPKQANIALAYRAENRIVYFDVLEVPPTREDYRSLAVEVPHFEQVIHLLNEREIAFERQRGLVPGHDALLLRDPAGNWVTIQQLQEVR